MADVYAVFGTLLALGIAFPGLLLAWSLLCPGPVARAGERFRHTPGRTFLLGLAGVFAAGLPVVLLLALPFGPAKLLGSVVLMVCLAGAGIGAAGIAGSMGTRLEQRTGWSPGSVRGFLGGAVALELAAAFPFLGWFLVIPTMIIFGLGATLFALLRWMPRTNEGSQANAAVDGALTHEPQSA